MMISVKKYLWFACLFSLVCSFTLLPWVGFAKQPDGIQLQADSIFQSIVAGLQSKTRVPLMLPSYLPKESYPLYVTISAASRDNYELFIGDQENCTGGNYCRYGTVSGKKISASTPSIKEGYAFMDDPQYRPQARSPEPMGQVILANGTKGYFIPYICGANCDDAKVVWEQNNYRYLVGLKRADKKTVVKMANSATHNTR